MEEARDWLNNPKLPADKRKAKVEAMLNSGAIVYDRGVLKYVGMADTAPVNFFESQNKF